MITNNRITQLPLMTGYFFISLPEKTSKEDIKYSRACAEIFFNMMEREVEKMESGEKIVLPPPDITPRQERGE